MYTPHRRKVRAAPDAVAKSLSNRSKTYGLVLEGGGAKGSFQFGCLSALADRGIEFDVIAGTSVGALNGALWSSGQLVWGKEFWKTISFGKVYPLRRPSLIFFPLAFAYALAKLISNWIGKRDAVRTAMYFALIGVALSVALTGFGLFISLCLYLIDRSTTLWKPRSSSEFGLLLLPLLPPLFIWLNERFGLSAFTSTQLKTNVTECLANRTFRVPLFVTVTNQLEIYDPDNLQYTSAGSASLTFSVPTSRKTYVPQYVPMTRGIEPAETLLASAALPFGIVPAVHDSIDGGVSDNLPLVPVISYAACDVVLILRANPGKLSRSQLLRHWSRTERLRRLVKYSARTAHEANPRPMPLYSHETPGPFKPYAPAEPERLPSRPSTILQVGPEWPRLGRLSDFAHRTMNFRPRFTVPQLIAGYQCMSRELDSGRLDLLFEKA